MTSGRDQTTKLIYKLSENHRLDLEEYVRLVSSVLPEHVELASSLAVQARDKTYGSKVFLRGLIEFTNYCKNNCLYCGIRSGNKEAQRYRLNEQEVLGCCSKGYGLGFRSFVLQGGEDVEYTPDRIARLVELVKKEYPDCALTLSVGEHSYAAYKDWFDAGADRYLLRHETADSVHYESLHPASMSYGNRMRCLHDLKAIGYQVGCGFMVGSPGQRPEHIAKDLLFMQEFKPHMVGIGPFIPHKNTPFATFPAGTLEQTLFLLSVVRLMLPDVLLPATTALGTICSDGRNLGILSGANVCMPNLSPFAVRQKYELYDNKVFAGDEAAESVARLVEQTEDLGCHAQMSRGDHVSIDVQKNTKEEFYV